MTFILKTRWVTSSTRNTYYYETTNSASHKNVFDSALITAGTNPNNSTFYHFMNLVKWLTKTHTSANWYYELDNLLPQEFVTYTFQPSPMDVCIFVLVILCFVIGFHCSFSLLPRLGCLQPDVPKLTPILISKMLNKSLNAILGPLCSYGNYHQHRYHSNHHHNLCRRRRHIIMMSSSSLPSAKDVMQDIETVHKYMIFKASHWSQHILCSFLFYKNH